MVVNDKKIEIRDRVYVKEKATADIIKRYCEISGDYNPIHCDEEYANKTKFGRCIAHGLFCLGLISKAIGMKLPGAGTIFINERLEYKRPVYVDDTVVAMVEITNIIEAKFLVEVFVECRNQKNVIVLDGTSLLKII